ncbi:hypothetical protein [Arabiibacter massiliensis]|uniref:hypothetical protein n=1 Tax=Arabiibacter massiliensis TaxID=1870985 RepID=UPI0009BABAE1|nr:hypothetical protein [Arabiibacter massiliensis]
METEKNVTEETNAAEAQPEKAPFRGWCIVANGLVDDGRERVIVDWGYSDKEFAESGMKGWKSAKNLPAHVAVKVMPAPKKCVVAKCEETGEGTVVLADEATRETLDWDAARAVVKYPDSGYCMLYPSLWTLGRKIAVAACALVLVAAVGVGIAVAANRPAPIEAGAPAASQPQVQQTGAEKAEESAVTVTVLAEGADAGATKVKVVATGSDGKAVVPETEVEANKASEIGRLSKGGYELHVTAAPVCADGSSYKLPEKPVAFKVDGKGADVKLDVKLEKIAAEDMTKEQLETAAKILAENGNAEASEAVQSKSEAAPSVPGSDSAVKHDPVPTPAPDNGGSSGGSGSNDSDSPNSGGGSNSGSTTPSNPTNPPAHEHSWTPVTKTVHHDAVYNTVHHDAVYSTIHHEAVYNSVFVCSGCGSQFSDAGSLATHNKQGMKDGTVCGTSGSYVDKIVAQEAWDEPVLVQGAYDEQVVISDAWDETVTTGYKCSCGATK